MSEQNGEDTGSKDRTTVALVGAEVREVKAIITGHAETTAAKLDSLGEKFDTLKGLPERQARSEERSDDHERRIDRLERRGTRAVATGISVVALLASIASALANLIH